MNTKESPNISRTDDVMLSYALGNIILFPFWYIAFARNGMPLDAKFIEHYFELSQIFDHVDYFAALLWGLILGVVIFAAIRFSPPKRRQLVIGLLIIPPFAGTLAIGWYIVFPPLGHARINSMWVLEGVAVMAITMLIILLGIKLKGPSVLQLVRTLVAMTAPVGLVMTLNAFVAYHKIDAPKGGVFHVDRSLSPIRNKEKKGPRVIIIFFDYWDYHYSFVNHPNFVKMKNVKKLMNSTFNGHYVSRNALSTFRAVPSTLSGHRVDYAERTGGDKVMVQYAGKGTPSNFRTQPTMFSDAHKAGYDVSVVATAYLPVCRMFPQYISKCVIDDHPFDYEYKTAFNRLDDVVKHTLWQVRPIRNLLFEKRREFHSHWGIHLKLHNLNAVKEAAIDPDTNFLYAHLMLPHSPMIWDSINKKYWYKNEDDAVNYFHSLEFLDLFIGDLKKTLEKAGQWNNTAVIFTADTGAVGSASPSETAFRKYGWDKKNRVPLIIHLPGQKHRVDMHQRVSAESLRTVVQQIMAGKLTKPEQIAATMKFIDYKY